MKQHGRMLCASCSHPVEGREVTPGSWRKFNLNGSPHVCELPVKPYGDLPGHANAATSRDAAVGVAVDLRKRQALILEALERRGPRGATADELVVELGSIRNSVAPRLTELHEAGLIERTTERRPTPAGASAFVYIARKGCRRAG